MPTEMLFAFDLEGTDADYLVPTSFIPSVTTHFFKSMRAAQARRWPLCRALGQSALGHGYSVLRDIQSEYQGLSTADLQLEIIAGPLINAASIGGENGQSIKDLANGVTELLSSLNEFSPGRGRLDWAIANLSRGLQVMMHAEFNLTFARAQEDEDGEKMQDAYLETRVQQFHQQITGQQLNLYSSCAKGDAPQTASRYATALAGEIEKHLPDFVRLQALAFLEIRRRLAKSQGVFQFRQPEMP